MIEEYYRAYRMPNANIAMFASNLVGTMTRDKAFFLIKGVSESDIDELDTLADAFASFPDDDYYLSYVMLAVDERNELRAKMTVDMRDIVQLASIKFGGRSAQVKSFDAGNMTREKDKIFVSTANLVALKAEEFLSELSALGLTQSEIDALKSDATAMTLKLSSIATYEMERDLKTRERVEKGNELYNLVAKYCEIGKFIFGDVSEAKYSHYVIYHDPPSKQTKPQDEVPEEENKE